MRADEFAWPHVEERRPMRIRATKFLTILRGRVSEESFFIYGASSFRIVEMEIYARAITLRFISFEHRQFSNSSVCLFKLFDIRYTF